LKALSRNDLPNDICFNGWVKFWYEDEGEFLLEKDDFVYHPPAAAHDLLDYSAEVEWLEVHSPSSPETIDV